MRKRGFTLVEVMVSVILASLVLGTAYQIWTSARRDFSTGSIRQVLQHEIRLALDFMIRDFKSAKRDTLQASKISDQEVIKFQRFEEKMDAAKLDSTQTYEVMYSWDPQTSVLTRTAKGSTKYLSTSIVSARIEQNKIPSTPGAPPGDPAANSQKARIDITLAGQRLIPATGKMASHTETVSVFMRDEFYGAMNQKQYVSIADMVEKKTNDLQIDDNNALLTLGALSKEQLRNMTSAELTDAEDKEKKFLQETNNVLSDIDNQIKDIDTKGDRHLSTFGMKKSSEFTDEQKKLQSHETSKEINEDRERITNKIKDREKKYIGIAMGTPDKTPDPIEQAAFDMKMKDWNMKKVYDEAEKNKKEGEKASPPPSALSSFNPANIQKGVSIDSGGNRSEFAESEAAFNARKDYAQKVYTAAGKIDIDRLQKQEGDENMRTYSAGKDILDLANAKYSAVLRREQSEENLKTIHEVMAEKR